MGCFGDMPDDPGTDGLFETPEEHARQRGTPQSIEEQPYRRSRSKPLQNRRNTPIRGTPGRHLTDPTN